MTKKSKFTALTSVPSGAYFDFVSSGTNYRISYSDLLSGLNVSSGGGYGAAVACAGSLVTNDISVFGDYKITTTWVPDTETKFTVDSDGTVTYTGTNPIWIDIDFSGVGLVSNDNYTIGLTVYKNDTKVANSVLRQTNTATGGIARQTHVLHWSMQVNSGDYFDIRVGKLIESADPLTILYQDFVMTVTAGPVPSEVANGGLNQAGAVTGVPVLDPQGAVNNIRNLEVASGSGLSAAVSAENGITLALNAQVASGTGVAVLDSSNKIRNIKAGTGIALSISGDDIVVTATGATGSQLTDNITANAGGGQDDAVELTTKYNRITTCATAGDSVKLPTAVAELERTVINAGAEVLYVYPGGGDSINELAVNTPIQIGVNGTAQFYCIDADKWVHL